MGVTTYPPNVTEVPVPISEGGTGATTAAGARSAIGALTSDFTSLTAKTTPVDADLAVIADSAASNVAKKVTWANIKATLKTYFDTLYAAAGTYLGGSTGATDNAVLRANGTGGVTVQSSLAIIDDTGNIIMPADAALYGGAFEIVRYSSGGGNILFNALGNRLQSIRLQAGQARSLIFEEDSTGNEIGGFRTDTDTFFSCKGANVASAAAIVPTGNLFHVTGTTDITSITATNIHAGTTITIIFDDVLTFTDGNNLKLAGNFVTSADDTITLQYDGTNFYETCRSTN